MANQTHFIILIGQKICNFFTLGIKNKSNLRITTNNLISFEGKTRTLSVLVNTVSTKMNSIFIRHSMHVDRKEGISFEAQGLDLKKPFMFRVLSNVECI